MCDYTFSPERSPKFKIPHCSSKQQFLLVGLFPEQNSEPGDFKETHILSSYHWTPSQSHLWGQEAQPGWCCPPTQVPSAPAWPSRLKPTVVSVTVSGCSSNVTPLGSTSPTVDSSKGCKSGKHCCKLLHHGSNNEYNSRCNTTIGPFFKTDGNKQNLYLYFSYRPT